MSQESYKTFKKKIGKRKCGDEQKIFLKKKLRKPKKKLRKLRPRREKMRKKN
jgi:hypothetical protein